MRCIPLAIWGHLLSSREIAQLAQQEASLTHANQICQVCACLQTMMQSESEVFIIMIAFNAKMCRSIPTFHSAYWMSFHIISSHWAESNVTMSGSISPHYPLLCQASTSLSSFQFLNQPRAIQDCNAAYCLAAASLIRGSGDSEAAIQAAQEWTEQFAVPGVKQWLKFALGTEAIPSVVNQRGWVRWGFLLAFRSALNKL